MTRQDLRLPDMRVVALLAVLRVGAKLLPPGRRRVVLALGENPGASYPQLAKELGIHVGTLHVHLRRTRELDSQMYDLLMQIRRGGLERRHERALARAQERSRRWFRKMHRMGYRHYGGGRWGP